MVFFSRRFSCGCVERWPRQLTRSHLTLSCQPDFAAFPPPRQQQFLSGAQQSNGRRPVRGGDWCVARSSLRRLPGGGDRPCAGVGTVPQYRLVLPFGRERLRSLRISNMAVAWGVLHHNVVAPQSPGFGTPRRKAWGRTLGMRVASRMHPEGVRQDRRGHAQPTSAHARPPISTRGRIGPRCVGIPHFVQPRWGCRRRIVDAPGFGPHAPRRGAEPWGRERRRECTLKRCDKTDVAPSVTGHIAHPRQSAFGIAAALLETRVTRGGAAMRFTPHDAWGRWRCGQRPLAATATEKRSAGTETPSARTSLPIALGGEDPAARGTLHRR